MSAISTIFLVLQILALVGTVVAVVVSVPYLSWVAGSRFFGEDPGRQEQDWRRRFLKRFLRGLVLSSHFGRGFLPEEENPFWTFDRHSSVVGAAVVSGFIAVFLLILILNHL